MWWYACNDVLMYNNCAYATNITYMGACLSLLGWQEHKKGRWTESPFFCRKDRELIFLACQLSSLNWISRALGGMKHKVLWAFHAAQMSHACTPKVSHSHEKYISALRNMYYPIIMLNTYSTNMWHLPRKSFLPPNIRYAPQMHINPSPSMFQHTLHPACFNTR